jgi:cation:H+ antiporter
MLDSLSLLQLIGVFGLSAGGIIGAGIVLARNGDAIAARTGLGGLFVGMLLMAGATSLPEIVTEVSAAAAGAPDLAIGDQFGSSMANMAILAIIDLIHRRRVWPGVGLEHARVAAIAIALTTVVLLGMVLPVRWQVGWIGVESIIVLAGYVAAAAWIRRSRRTEATGPVQPDGPPGTSDDLLMPTGWGARRPMRPLRHHVVAFAAAAAVVVLAAPVVALTAHAIAGRTGLGETFIGATLLALATSLPELVSSLAALQIGAYDLAVGNLFGSNAINATIVFFADAAYLPGPILAAVSTQQLVAGLGGIVLMATALGGIVHGARTRFHRGEPDAIALLIIYVVLLWILWSGAA